jgi:TolB-like protein/DNA-binding SARP family transcriptional activator
MRALSPDGADMLPRARKTRALLACLCLAEGERVSRSRLIGLLWDRSADAQARMSLRHALSELKGIATRYAPSIVEIDRESARIDVTSCWIDALAVLGAYSGAAAPLDALPPRPGERLLEDLDGITPSFDHWLASERSRFGDRVRALLEADLEALVAQEARPEARAAAARRLLNCEPAHEGACRALMMAFAQMGDRAQAVREYERSRRELHSLLDLTPAKETTALYDAIRLTSPRAPAAVRPAALQPIDDGARPGPPALDAGSDNTIGGNHPSGGVQTTGLRDRPSIAVLPFDNLTGEGSNEQLCDGLAEDLIEALSRIPDFFVVSRLSTLAFKRQARLPREIGDVLGVRYVLSGSMRAFGNRLRLTNELTDTQSGGALWTARLDMELADLFDLQDQVSVSIVKRVAPYLHAAELKRLRAKRPENLEAYDFFLRAREIMHNSSRATFESAQPLFDASIARDPHFATSLAWRAYWHALRIAQGWSPDVERDRDDADRFAQQGVEADSTDPMALAIHGHLAGYLHQDFDLGFRRLERALSVNVNSAPAWLWSSAAHAWLGHGPKAVDQINWAMALTPYDPMMYAYSGIAGMAYLADGQYERAVECGLRCVQENQTYTHAYRLLTIALVLAGRVEEARAPMGQLLQIDPDLTVPGFLSRYPGRGCVTAEIYAEALARAGLPRAASGGA